MRLLSATNADLHAEVAAGRFRQDLLYRLNTVELRLPPLRDRPEDIPALAAHFLAEAPRALPQAAPPGARRCGGRARCWPTPGPATSANSTTPIERAVLLASGRTRPRRRPRLVARARVRVGAAGGGPALEEMSLEEVEQFLIQKAMARHGGKADAAAEALGLSRSAFYRRLQQYGL